MEANMIINSCVANEKRNMYNNPIYGTVELNFNKNQNGENRKETNLLKGCFW